MAKTITEIIIDVETKSISINTKEQIVNEQYSYLNNVAQLSDSDKSAILAIVAPYLNS